MTTAQRVADLTRELPEDAQIEVLDFVEFLRAKRLTRRAPDGGPDERGSLEQLRAALQAFRSMPVDAAEPEWSPMDVEPLALGGPNDDNA